MTTNTRPRAKEENIDEDLSLETSGGGGSYMLLYRTFADAMSKRAETKHIRTE
jgi:hypothetical protein